MAAHSPLSAKLAAEAGFDGIWASGFELSALYGLPDVSLITMTQHLDMVRAMAERSSLPVVADIDTGFGNAVNVVYAVTQYERAGAAAIQIEDQVFPKKCGHTPGRRVVPIDQMVRKIEVAAASRSSADFLIVARTDARTNHGLDEALRRGEAYAKAGADILFIESPESEEEMAKIGRHFDVPLLANMADGGRTPILPRKRLEELGYKIAIFPATGFLAVANTLERVYGVLKDKGSSDTLGAEFYPFDKFCRLVGFEHVWEFDKRWPEA